MVITATAMRSKPREGFEAGDIPGMKMRLLGKSVANEKARATPSDTNTETDTMRMSLDEWVAHEKRTCSRSRASEAARRIRAVEHDPNATVLDLRQCHMHSVPPLVGCKHVRSYNLMLNYLMRIPNDLKDLPNLSSLEVGSTGLREVPQCRKYKALKFLSASGNPVSHVPSTLSDRGVIVSMNATLASKWTINQYRAGQRRLKIRDFLKRLVSRLPDRCLPRLADDMPTFDGGGACDQNLKPYPFLQRCSSLEVIQADFNDKQPANQPN